MKGLAICIVAFVWHYQHFQRFQPSAGSPFYKIISVSYNYGWLMVELFFMLSGFGMMLGYGQKILERKICFKDYVYRRFTKLYPLMLLSLLLVSVFELLYMRKMQSTFVYQNFDVYHFVLNLLCIQTGIIDSQYSFNGPSWGISICMLLYMLFYYIASKSKSKAEICIRMVGVGLLGMVIHGTKVDFPIFNDMVARGLMCFSVGVVLAEFYDRRQYINTKRVGYLSLTGLFLIYITIRFVNVGFIGDVQMLFIITISPLIILSVLYVRWVNLLLQSKIFAYLGKISLDIYLLHFPVQCALVLADSYLGLNLNYSSKKVFVLYFLLTILISSVYEKCIRDRYHNVLTKCVEMFLV